MHEEDGYDATADQQFFQEIIDEIVVIDNAGKLSGLNPQSALFYHPPIYSIALKKNS